MFAFPYHRTAVYSTHCTYNYRNFALTNTLLTCDGTVVYRCIDRHGCGDVKELSTLFATTYYKIVHTLDCKSKPWRWSVYFLNSVLHLFVMHKALLISTNFDLLKME